MSFDGKSLDDYNTVADRLVKFRADQPEGRTRPVPPAGLYDVVTVPNGWCRRCRGDRTVKIGGNWKTCPRCEGSGVRAEHEPKEDVFIVYAAAVYRDAGDELPGIGMAWEPYPGRTPYTERSELMNAETSAIGRGLVAANIADARKGVSSADEVQNREAEREQDSGSGGRWMNRRPDLPPKDLQDRRTPTPTTGAEHEQLRDGTVEATPRDRPAKRARGQAPEGDPWLDQPPGTYDERPPEELPGSMTEPQRRRLFQAFADLGITRPSEQRDALSGIVKRPISSRKDLSLVEMDATVLPDLDARVEAKEAAEAAQAAADGQDAAEVDAP